MNWKKMVRMAVLTMAVAATAALVYGQDRPQDVQLLDVKTGTSISAKELAARVDGYDVIFFGEFHDKPAIHRMEETVMKALYERHKKNLVLSMEMFERDVQGQVDAYLAGTISEEEFLASSRPWERYKTDYKGLVDFGKEKKLPVIASNIPRYMASTYAKTGTLDAIAEEQRQYLPAVHYAPEGAYKEKFIQAMSGMGEGGMHVMADRIPAMYKAQSLKDDTMAESIAQYKDKHPSAVIFHVQGEFHGGQRLGVVQKLAALRPELKLAVISSIQDTKESTEEIIKHYGDYGDFLLIDRSK